jgi:multidrug efflux system membrane fusion protein
MEDTVGENGPPPPADSGPPRAAPATSAAPRRNRWWRWLLVLIGVLLMGVLIWRLVFGHKKATPPPPPAPVGVAKIATGDMDVELRGIGTVTPVATITIQALVSGLLFNVDFKEGQIVRAGQRLVLIDPRPFENALASAKGQLVRDTGALEQARSDLARFLILSRQDSIAQQTVTDQEYLVRQNEGTVMVDRANVKTAELNLYYTRVLAPVTGRVGLRLVDPGNYIQVGSSTALAVVTQLQPITVVFVLPQADVEPVAEQMSSGKRLEVEAWDGTNTHVIAKGQLLAVDNTADTTTGTVKLRASFGNSDLRLFPNEFVNARLKLETLKGVTVAPVRAIQQGAPGTFVYLLRPNGTVHVQVIKTGVTQGDRIQVLSGVQPGDTVVVDGVDRLREGAKVRVAPAGTVHNRATNNGPGAPPGQQPQNAAPPATGGRRARASG